MSAPPFEQNFDLCVEIMYKNTILCVYFMNIMHNSFEIEKNPHISRNFAHETPFYLKEDGEGGKQSVPEPPPDTTRLKGKEPTGALRLPLVLFI